MTYFKQYEETFGEEKAEELIFKTRETVDIVIDYLDKDHAFNGFTFLSL